MSKNKFPRSVSFNTNNEIDVAILKYVKKRNFSGYVKKLIIADMEKNKVVVGEQSDTMSKLDQLRQTVNSYTNQSTDTDSD